MEATKSERKLRRCTHSAQSKAIKLAQKMGIKEDDRQIQDFEVTWINPDDYHLEEFLLPQRK